MAHRHSPQTTQNRQSLLNKPSNEVSGIDAENVIEGGLNNVILSGSGNQIIQSPGVDEYPSYSSIITGVENRILRSSYSTIVGGWHNEVIGDANSHSIISGGFNNVINTTGLGFNSIAGGSDHDVTGLTRWSAIVGGFSNTIDESWQAVAAGGYAHTIEASSLAGFLGGGSLNTLTGAERSAIIGGHDNLATHNDSVMLGCSNKTSVRDYTTHVERFVIFSCPTSSAGLTTGSVWRNGTVLNIV